MLICVQSLKAEALSQSLPLPSFPPFSLPLSLPPSLPPSLPLSLPPSLPPSLPLSLPLSLSPSLLRSYLVRYLLPSKLLLLLRDWLDIPDLKVFWGEVVKGMPLEL